MSDIYISWDEYNKKIEQLAIQVYQDGWKFNQVVCIAKGGLRIGDVFSRLFNVPLAILSVESYNGKSNEVKDQQGQFTFSRDLAKTTPNLGSRVLLVDDLADSGKTLIKSIYNSQLIKERHRHRYEVNINYKDQFEKKGMIFSGLSPDNKLPEIIELKNHPWFIGVQFHPEFKSRPLSPHPLFSSFIKAAKNHKK